MPDPNPPQSLPDLRLSALSRWDNEGGAVAAAGLEINKGLRLIWRKDSKRRRDL